MIPFTRNLFGAPPSDVVDRDVKPHDLVLPKRRVQVVDAASYMDACTAQREVTCRHFTGTAWGICKLGLTYDSVRTNLDGGASVFACVQDEAWEERGRPTCEKYSRRTPEEIEADRYGSHEFTYRMNKGLPR